MTKILAFIDDASYQDAICQFIITLKDFDNVSVTLLHCLKKTVIPINQQDYSGEIGLGAHSALLKNLSESDIQTSKIARQKAENLLQQFKQHLIANGLRHIEVLLRHDTVQNAVKQFSPSHDIVILGKNSKSSFPNPTLASNKIGQNIEQAIENCQKPIIILGNPKKKLHKVIFAYDGSPQAEKAVTFLCDNRLFTQASLQLLMVKWPNIAATDEIENAANRLRQKSYRVDVTVVEGQLDEIILNTITKDNIDMLIMGAYGHSSFRRMIMGSTTNKMLKNCPIPIMLMP